MKYIHGNGNKMREVSFCRIRIDARFSCKSGRNEDPQHRDVHYYTFLYKLPAK